MATYYQILGVSPQASVQEIKIAFRKLAKQHHPDVNPMGKEAFARILIAYETLTDPQQRRLYDLSISENIPQKPRPQGGFDPQKKQKEWSFSEEELKRRQYYQEYYKSRQYTHPEVKSPKKPYNDYKFILFATPIAVALLMFIFFIYEPREKTKGQTPPVAAAPSMKEQEAEDIHQGDSPYSDYFGNTLSDSSSNNKLRIKNATPYNAVVALFRHPSGAFVRSIYLQSNYRVNIDQVPNGQFYMKFVLGKRWNSNKEVNQGRLYGGFDSLVMYGHSAEPLRFKGNDESEIQTIDLDTTATRISESDFFKKP